MTALRRYSALSVLLLVLTFIVTAVAYFAESPTYRASSSIAFIPSRSFGIQTGAGNQYLAFTASLNQLGDIIRYEVSSRAETTTLAAAGYTSSYTITDPTDTAAPILLVTTNGKDGKNVENTLAGVDAAISAKLSATQSGMKAAARITDKVLTFTIEPTRISSTKNRPTIIVLVGGLLLSYVIISTVDSFQMRRRDGQGRHMYQAGQSAVGDPQ